LREKIIASTWLENNGRRLDCGPYLYGAIEARLLLDSLPVHKRPLRELTAGGPDGIFHAGRETRRYVQDPHHGHPFLSSTDILQSDLSLVALISKKQVASTPKLVIREGWTLITRSGTIGRMAYARPEMDGMACSEHVLRVVPDEKVVPPGYLYAYLSSRFGLPLVVGGTYGAIIQHIEPEHVWDLPIPRLGDAVEKESHRLVKRAGDARTRASELLETALGDLHALWGIRGHAPLKAATTPDVVSIPASQLNARLDAFYHSTGARNADLLISEVTKRVPVRALAACTERVFETPRFSRIPVRDVAYGAPFMSIADLARVDPVPENFVSKRQVAAMDAAVASGWLILPRVGQLQGLFGHVVCIPPHLDGVAVSDNNIRIVPRSQEDSGYLFASLSSEICYWQVIRRACGTSIPYLDSTRVKQVPVPWPEDAGARNSIAAKVNEAMELRSEAVRLERRAVAIVEQAIGEGNA
jgi:type I restriction enzyme S subunit